MVTDPMARSDLERIVLQCPEHLQKKEWFNDSDLKEYFANAPLAFRPKILAQSQGPNHPNNDNECRFCFKEIDDNRDTVRCNACHRVAHLVCHLICSTRKAGCEGDACPLWCPECPWTRKREKVEPGVILVAVKDEPAPSKEFSAAVFDGSLTARKRKFDGLKQEEEVGVLKKRRNRWIEP